MQALKQMHNLELEDTHHVDNCPPYKRSLSALISLSEQYAMLRCS